MAGAATEPAAARRPDAPRPATTVMLFFIVGPLRTGSSLLSRCIDDHPQAICLCESEINRALFAPHALRLHLDRMRAHGLTGEEIIDLLNGHPQGSIEAWLAWYRQAVPLLRRRLDKPDVQVLGDKSPDFFLAPPLLDAIAHDAQAIYTVRDPRAILRSIWRQTDANAAQKAERWDFLKRNIRAWRPHWDRPNVLVSRYEDLVRDPVPAMTRVYAHLGLQPSTRFLEPFERLHPRRFLWDTAVDWQSGVRKDFDPARAEISDADLTADQRAMVWDDEDVRGFMARFGYG